MAQLSVPRYRRMVLAMKPETTYGTDVFGGTYTSADIIPCFDISPKATLEQIENLSMAGDIGRLPSIAGQEYAQVSFAMRLRGLTTAFDDSPTRLAPEVDLPWRGCGLAATFGGASGGAFNNLSYAPSNTHESMTIYIAQEIQGAASGPTMKITGALGSFSINYQAGQPSTIRFTFTGIFGGRADVTYVAGSPASTPLPPTLKSATMTIAAVSAPCVGSVDFDSGNVVSRVSCINAATGVIGVFISDRRPTLRIDPQAVNVTTKDWIDIWRAGTLQTVSFLLGNTGSQFNILNSLFNRCQIIDQGYGQREGLTTFPTEYMPTVQAGNDDYAFAWQ